MIEKALAINSLRVPSCMLERLLAERIEVLEGIILFYWLILTSRNSKSPSKSWAPISDEEFKRIASNNTQRRMYREWLEDNGYIKIRKWKCEDGVVRNRRVRGGECQKYQAIVPEGTQIEYHFSKLHIGMLFPKADVVSDEPMCIATQCNLKLLEPVRPFALPEKMTTKNARDWGAYFRLSSGAVSVNRGRKVTRLYSTWATASSKVRSMFRFCGEDFKSLDLQAAQPTIVASLAEDQQMLHDCLEDKLYGNVSRELGLDREGAKSGFCAYIFGEPRTANARNRIAYDVQELMKRLYPKASYFVTERKRKTSLAAELQNMEASIFVDGAFAELVRQKTPALTVHDSIYFPETKESVVRAVLSRHLQKALGHNQFKIR